MDFGKMDPLDFKMDFGKMEPLDLSCVFPDLWCQQQFVTLDGLNSGVPTRTTPTLTPTTLRNIEQTLIELQCETVPHQNEAGFVPPVVQPITQAGNGNTFMSVDSKGWQGGCTTVSQSRPSVVTTASAGITPTSTRRNMGGRRPMKDDRCSPEEEERRRVRRERNKLAAARCRKRRMDHTNALLIETDGLEQKKQSLQNEIQQLQMQKEELEFLLEAHKACCRLNTSSPASPPDIKPIVFPITENKEQMRLRVKAEQEMAAPITVGHSPAKRVMLGGNGAKPPRPNSLPVAAAFTPSSFKVNTTMSEVAGVPITTPSTGIEIFNFESLMEGGTGLTPVSGSMGMTPVSGATGLTPISSLVPSCSSQQRNSSSDLSSPDSIPPKLVSL